MKEGFETVGWVEKLHNYCLFQDKKRHVHVYLLIDKSARDINLTERKQR